MGEEKVLFLDSLCFLRRGSEVCLAIKKKKIGAGRWNGYGGGVEENETIDQTTRRELAEESGGVQADPFAMEKVAIVDFHNITNAGERFVCQVHVYFAWRWVGEPKESEEMGPPKWAKANYLPTFGMMPADTEWLPLILAGKKILAEAHYGPHQKMLLHPVIIREVDRLE